MTDKLELIISPSSLNLLESCARHYQYSKIMNLGKDGPKDEKLERGDLIHQVLDFYFKGKIDGKSHEEMLEPAIDFGRFIANGMDLEVEATEYFLATAREWLEFHVVHYFWKPLHSESPFSLLFYEDDSLRILLEGKIDLIIQLERQPEITAWTDHKSREKTVQDSPLENQFMAYAYAFRDITHHGFVNEIGLQKSKGPEDKFKIHPLTFNEANLEEWRETTIYHCKLLESYIRLNHFPMNHASCKFCEFREVCKEPPNLRERMIEAKFIQKPEHDLFGVKS